MIARGWHGDTTDEDRDLFPIRGIAMPSVGIRVSDEADWMKRACGPPGLRLAAAAGRVK
jgi:hypothetical protein